MAELRRIQETIRELAGRRKNVELSEIQWVINQLALLGYRTTARKTRHSILFSVDSHRFGVCSHNPGSGQVKACYVNDFIDAMIDLGIYED